MPRTARLIIPLVPHHVTQRGNYRQVVFEDDQDRQVYLDWVKDYSVKYGLRIWAYCLMSNHVHFIVVPLLENSLSLTFHYAHMRYSQYFNRKKNQKGHLWQGRFFSCCLDEPHLVTAVKYVENNPVRAGLVEQAEEYPWSSAAHHVKGTEDPLLSDDLPLLRLIPDWREFLLEKDEEALLKEVKTSTLSGRPAGSEDFVREMEEKTGKTIRTRPKGRPKKQTEENI